MQNMSKISALSRPYIVGHGRKFRLQDHETRSRGSLDTDEAQDLLRQSVERISQLQEKLYAQDRWGLLLIFQAMDAAGKDSAIKHVMSGINPQGCQVYSFKAPSAEELNHEYLWRAWKSLPERGRIGIFNRSYYEETLVVRVHPDLLERQKLPPALVSKRIWKDRYEDINAFERYLTRNGFVIRKFFLHVSKAEQRKRFEDRLDDPKKNWKFSAADVLERARWRDYMDAYEDTIRHTATDHAPWVIVPADDKSWARLIVASAVIDALKALRLEFPEVDAARRRELARARRLLNRE
jgi:PPK2 family polyphosphate:nucleotide phosphotransferase